MAKEAKQEPMDKVAGRYIDEFSSWKEDLKKYWEAIDKNQEMYEFFKREETETQSDISLNTPFSIVESMVAKANEATLNVTVNAEGELNLDELEKWVGAVLKDSIEDRKIARLKGSFRKIRERFFRSFLVKGNAVATVEWCYKTQIIKGNKKVVADNPYVKLRNLKSVIFNPAFTLCDSDVYYLESHVKFSDLKSLEYDDKTKKGIYKNLGKLKEQAAKDNIELDDEHYYSDDKKVAKKAPPIRILERWEGTKLIVIADKVIIREENDPFSIGGHNIITAMNYVVDGRPYAYGELDPIYKTVRAQDTVVNQSLDIVNRHLRPIVFAKNGMDIDQLALIIETGGVMEGDPTMVGELKLQAPPQQAFTTVETLQQTIERTARYSPYSAGVPASSTDKTSGTKGGIIALQSASEPNFQIKLDAFQEAFMQNVGWIYLTMIANKMSPDDVRYGLIQGKSKEWVKANKAVLQGNPTIKDLVFCGYLSEEASQQYLMTEEPTGQVDETGQPIMQQVPIKGSDKALVFDIDWITDIKLDNQSASDKEQEANNKFSLIKQGMEMGVQFSPERTIAKLGKELGWTDIEDSFLNEEEIAKKQQEMIAQQQQQQQAQEAQATQQAQQKQAEAEQQVAMKQMDNEARLKQEQIRGQNGLNKAQSTVV